ncbi:hypothetical protein [Pseudonocardia sp.]|uniref:hypothetical protein n=1 Tax=Pseudonocardia sp. TaxID=60912 RepID=UPI0031FD6A04
MTRHSAHLPLHPAAPSGAPAEFGQFAGTALQLLGLVVALDAGVVATTIGLRRR